MLEVGVSSRGGPQWGWGKEKTHIGGSVGP